MCDEPSAAFEEGGLYVFGAWPGRPVVETRFHGSEGRRLTVEETDFAEAEIVVHRPTEGLLPGASLNLAAVAEPLKGQLAAAAIPGLDLHPSGTRGWSIAHCRTVLDVADLDHERVMRLADGRISPVQRFELDVERALAEARCFRTPHTGQHIFFEGSLLAAVTLHPSIRAVRLRSYQLPGEAATAPPMNIVVDRGRVVWQSRQLPSEDWIDNYFT